MVTDDPEEVRELYRQWADSYDSDLDQYGYVAPLIGVSLFKDRVADKNAVIHDAGCGTGQVGKLLKASGYRNLHGSDFSSDMLAIAKSIGCYLSLVQADYTESLDFKSNSVDGIISIGVYTKRFKNKFIPEILRMLKPGGCLLFSCRPVYCDEVAESVKVLHQQNEISKSSVIYDDYMIGQNASAYYIALQKTDPDAGT